MGFDRFSDFVCTEEKVNGEPVVDEFVSLGTPFERFMERVNDAENGDAGEERFEGISVSDAHFEAMAEGVCAFLEHGFEVEWAEENAR